jgi:hypothetical protein
LSADELDRKLREAWQRDPVETNGLESAIRRNIERRSRRPIALLIAAAALLACGVSGYRFLQPPRMLADAALDHRAEVAGHAPRHWRTTAAEIDPLLKQYSAPAIPALRLLRAKVCGLGGKRVLHLVYTDGRKEYSLYVPGKSESIPQGDAQQGREHVEGIPQGIIVVDGAADDCRRFVTFLSQAV